jgi:hypothetical protein
VAGLINLSLSPMTGVTAWRGFAKDVFELGEWGPGLTRAMFPRYRRACASAGAAGFGGSGRCATAHSMADTLGATPSVESGRRAPGIDIGRPFRTASLTATRTIRWAAG